MDAGGLLPEARSADHHPSGKCHGKDDLQANEWAEMHDTPCHLTPFRHSCRERSGDTSATPATTPQKAHTYRVRDSQNTGHSRGLKPQTRRVNRTISSPRSSLLGLETFGVAVLPERVQVCPQLGDRLLRQVEPEEVFGDDGAGVG